MTDFKLDRKGKNLKIKIKGIGEIVEIFVDDNGMKRAKLGTIELPTLSTDDGFNVFLPRFKILITEHDNGEIIITES